MLDGYVYWLNEKTARKNIGFASSVDVPLRCIRMKIVLFYGFFSFDVFLSACNLIEISNNICKTTGQPVNIY